MIWTALSNCALLTMIFCWLCDAEFQSRYPVYIGEAVQEGRGKEAQYGSAMPAMEHLMWALTRRKGRLGTWQCIAP
jgi:hypothetical protein